MSKGRASATGSMRGRELYTPTPSPGQQEQSRALPSPPHAASAGRSLSDLPWRKASLSLGRSGPAQLQTQTPKGFELQQETLYLVALRGDDPQAVVKPARQTGPG